MSRFHLALLASMVLGNQVWAQASPRALIPPPAPVPTPSDPADAVPQIVPDSGPAVFPPFIQETTENDSSGCGGGCCNLAQRWRRLGINQCADDLCRLDDMEICGPVGRFWGDLDYLFWRVQGDHLPALVTTSPTVPLTPTAAAGVLPAATTLIGGESFNDSTRSGVRLNLGGWINRCQTFGFQIGGFMLLDQSETRNLGSGGDPILARPFQNALNNPLTQASQLIAYPGAVSGSVNVHEQSKFNGFDFAFRGNVCYGATWRVDALIGYRYLRFSEQLTIREQLLVLANGKAVLGLDPGTTVSEFDRFDVGNDFHGAQAGFGGTIQVWEKLSVGGTAKMSFGVVDQRVSVVGSTRFSTDTANRTGGLLALDSNIGQHTRSDNTLVPELNLNLGYQVTGNIRLRVGYDLIYFPNVQRAGGAIDLGINPNRIPPGTANPGVARPAFNHTAPDLYIQGVSAGLEFRF